jgi:phosphoserine phosphatase
MLQTAGRRVVVFDCDSTLSSIEGIDWLAARRGVKDEVAALTAAAMSGAVPLEAVYSRRLALAHPTRADLAALAAAYFERVVPDAAATIAALGAAGWEAWVASGGLEPAVIPLAARLGIPAARVRAVPIDLDAPDPWVAAARHPLASMDGKRVVVGAIVEGAGNSALVGDGATDLAARPAVDRFVAYGGVAAREAVLAAADAWVRSASLAPLLPLLAGTDAAPHGGRHAEVWARGSALLAAGEAGYRADG